jgi:hypothetical protein
MASTGIEWINDYRGRAQNLKHSNDNARGFQNSMRATKGFECSQNNAWDADWEKIGRPVNIAYWYVETVDIAYFAGQGSTEGPIFSYVSSYSDGVARYNEVRLGGVYSMGAYHRLKCVIFDAPFVLSNPNNWGSSFEGLRHILGFSTSRSDSGDRGRYFAQYLQTHGMRVKDAWKKACVLTEDPGKRWCWVYANYQGIFTYSDTWPFAPSKETKPTMTDFERGSC